MLSDLTVYADGRFASYDETKVGLLTHGLQYGTGCFEGVRGFWSECDGDLYLFRVRDHYERLAQSAKMLLITLPHAIEELTEITIDLVTRNKFRRATSDPLRSNPPKRSVYGCVMSKTASPSLLCRSRNISLRLRV